MRVEEGPTDELMEELDEIIERLKVETDPEVIAGLGARLFDIEETLDERASS